MNAHCQVVVGGPLDKAASRALRDQFDRVVVSTRHATGQTTLDLAGLDQPALRGLLILLWDLGHDVIAVTSTQPDPSSSRSHR